MRLAPIIAALIALSGCVSAPETRGPGAAPESISPALVQVCRGSGAYIGPHRILTAWHVVRNCPGAKVILADKAHDIAVIETKEGSPFWLTVACEPSKLALTASHTGAASSMRWTGGDSFQGHVYPGMSGSPIVNADSEVFAVVTRGPDWDVNNFFRTDAYGGMLARTKLCRNRND